MYEYVVDAQNVVTGSIQVISANSGKQAKVASVNQAYVPWLAWSEDSATLAFYARPRNGHASVQETINWVDVNTGKVQHTLTSAEIPAGWISSVFSFRGVEQLGITDFFPGNSSYSYNYPMKEIEAFALPDLLENPDFIEVIAAPASFSGEEVCESKPR